MVEMREQVCEVKGFALRHHRRTVPQLGLKLWDLAISPGYFVRRVWEQLAEVRCLRIDWMGTSGVLC